MEKKFLLLILILPIILLNACSRSKVLDLKYKERKNVANCIFNPEDTWKVQLFQTAEKFGDTSLSRITNATVFITNGSNADTIILSNNLGGNYVSAQKPLAGTRYNLIAAIPGSDTLFATDSIPNAELLIEDVFIDSINTKSVLFAEGSFGMGYPLTMQLRDTSIGSNFYEIRMMRINQTLQAAINLPFSFFLNRPGSPMGIETNDWNFTTLGKKYSVGLLFTDQFFNKKSTPIELFNLNVKYLAAQSDSWNGVNYDSIPVYFPAPNKFDVYIMAYSYSESRYQYFINYYKQNIANYDPFGTFITSYTNIQNGLGIFAGERRKIMKIY